MKMPIAFSGIYSSVLWGRVIGFEDSTGREK